MILLKQFFWIYCEGILLGNTLLIQGSLSSLICLLLWYLYRCFSLSRLSRCTSITTGEDGPIPRCKPFKYTYEKEIVIYPCHSWKIENIHCIPYYYYYYYYLVLNGTSCRTLTRFARMLISRGWTTSPQNVINEFIPIFILMFLLI